MKKMKHTVVLSTIIQGKKHFIAQHISIRTHDNRVLVEYTQRPEEAREFDSGKEAYQFKEDIVNPHERIIQVDMVVVDVEARKKHLAAALEVLQ